MNNSRGNARGKKPASKRGPKGSGRPTRGFAPQSTAGEFGIGTTKGGQPILPPRERTPRNQSVDVHDEDGVRLQKVLAQANVGSRRHCEVLIAEGRVTVNDQVVTELGTRVDPSTAVIHVDGMRIQLDDTLVYIAFNKPTGVVSTMHDEEGRPSVGEYVEGRTERLFHVGRLDQDTEGLLLLTNDGQLANRLQHPKYGVPKVYLATIHGPVPRDLGKRLREGIELEDGPVKVDSFKVVDSQPGLALVEIVIHEGRNHIVRRMLEEVGFPVIALARPQVGPVKVGDLRPGKMRPLNQREIQALYKAAGL